MRPFLAKTCALYNTLFYTAVAHRDLGGCSIDTTKLDSLAVSESVHGGERNVETRGSMVNSQNVDALALVGELPAGTTGGRVPSRNGLSAADVWELGDVALRLPAIPRDQAILAIRAGHGCERPGRLIVAGVIRDYLV